MNSDERRLRDLEGVGKEFLKDFDLLGIKSVAELSKRDPDGLYRELCILTGTAQDICVLDTFRCAVAQARNPRLPEAQRKWWYWSKKRKESTCREKIL
jgi:hypothetical protein